MSDNLRMMSNLNLSYCDRAKRGTVRSRSARFQLIEIREC